MRLRHIINAWRQLRRLLVQKLPLLYHLYNEESFIGPLSQIRQQPHPSKSTLHYLLTQHYSGSASFIVDSKLSGTGQLKNVSLRKQKISLVTFRCTYSNDENFLTSGSSRCWTTFQQQSQRYVWQWLDKPSKWTRKPNR